MKPRAKAVTGTVAVAVVAVAFFLAGCDGNIVHILGAILILAGKEGYEYRSVRKITKEITQ